METLFAVIEYFVIGFFALIGLLILAALLFGKRVRKQWEYEAEFRDANGREFGEFEIESSRIEKQEPDYTLKARFHLRHASLQPGQRIEIRLDDTPVLEGRVDTPGRIRMSKQRPRAAPR
ncbi:MAG: hypothetical protein R3288_08015, partial [Woeseiaceae bacterium]|nr:hypothetical protein [Woeseiaceae bacterium]